MTFDLKWKKLWSGLKMEKLCIVFLGPDVLSHRRFVSLPLKGPRKSKEWLK